MIFELYIESQNLEKNTWKDLIRKVEKRLDTIDTAALDIYLGVDEMTFFLHTRKDFGKLSNEFLPFIFKKEHEVPPIHYKRKKKCYPRVDNVNNFLTLKEKQEFSNHRTLKRITFQIHKLLFFSWYKVSFYFLTEEGTLYLRSKRFKHFPSHLLEMDLSKLLKYKKKSVPIYVKLQETLNLFTPNKEEGFLEAVGFPYLNNPEYFPIRNYDLGRHSLIVGQTGTGKSKFIELFVKELYKHKLTDEYTIVVIDPHASLYKDFIDIPNNINVDFYRTACQLFAQIGEPKVATELTMLLFQTLMKDQFNPKMERVLKYTLFVLFATSNMSLEALKRFVTEIVYRKEILSDKRIGDQILQFFDTDYIELETKFYEQAISPILTLLDELTFLPISNFQESESLKTLVENNSLVFLSLNKIMLGDKATKLIAGLLIQQLFLLAQSRVFNKKLIFIIDEVSVVQNDALSAILSEARKFDLSLFLTQQYLGQVENNLLKSIITNVYNYFIFKISEDDSKVLVNNLEFEFTEDQLHVAREEKGLNEEGLRVRMITTLNPRECVTRVYKDGKFYPVFKAKTMDI